MIRLNMAVEGQTEEGFINQLLAEHLANQNIFVACRVVPTGRKRGQVFRGGVVNYDKVKRFLHIWMKEDQRPEAHFTTMLDLYRLPTTFPGFGEAGKERDPFARVQYLEASLREDIGHPRFIPYIQLHEFEALLLSDPSRFKAVFLTHDEAIARLGELASRFDSPEHIDDGSETSPSKRIIKEIREYEKQKASAGPLIASKIGLVRMRQACRHFDEWITQLESLSR